MAIQKALGEKPGARIALGGVFEWPKGWTVRHRGTEESIDRGLGRGPHDANHKTLNHQGHEGTRRKRLRPKAFVILRAWWFRVSQLTTAGALPVPHGLLIGILMDSCRSSSLLAALGCAMKPTFTLGIEEEYRPSTRKSGPAVAYSRRDHREGG